MGCVVNGPGEALHADVAVCGGGNGKCLVYEDGKLMGKISANDVVSVLESRVRARVNAENQK